MVEGLIRSRLMFEPESLWDFGTIATQDEMGFSTVVFSPTREDLEVTGVTFDDEKLRAEFTPFEDFTKEEMRAKSAVRIDVFVAKGLPAGEFRGNAKIKIRFGDSEERTHEMPVQGRVTGSVQYIPGAGTQWNLWNRAITLGDFSASEGQKATLNIILTAPEGVDEPVVEIVEDSISPKYFKAELKGTALGTSKRRKRFVLTVEVPAGSPRQIRQGRNAGRVTLKTNSPDEPEIPVSVHWTAR